MHFLADFHIHSKYSRATAANLDFENVYRAAQLKGITVVGTGDFTHPLWWREINEKLTPAEHGLFKLKDEIALRLDKTIPAACRATVRFILATEISNIYKKSDKTRKNHNLVFMPDLASAEKLNQRLDVIGNIRADGRPILGLDARNLLEIVLEINSDGFLIPAHIWTPWFSLLGSKSGFDSVEACFEDLSDYIFALETGLSSDPQMNWRVSNLDRYTLVSNSDAHSPSKLGREANLFKTQLNYPAIRRALEKPDEGGFLGTLEFYPEEGKYHLDGHRKCGFRSFPEKTRDLNGICPVCGKPLTLGVLYRVEELSDRDVNQQPSGGLSYESLIPLEDVLGAVFEVGVKSKKVAQAYHTLINRFGCELNILRTVPISALEQCGIALLAESIKRMRASDIYFEAGYDGEFGKLKLFDHADRRRLSGQQNLFDSQVETNSPRFSDDSLTRPTPTPDDRPKAVLPSFVSAGQDHEYNTAFVLNNEQQDAIDHKNGPLMIKAGPGTGKTRTITCRVAELVKNRKIDARTILAVTFTNQAAREMRGRLAQMMDDSTGFPLICTFHGFCWRLLREVHQENQSAIADDMLRRDVLSDAVSMVKSDGVKLSHGRETLLKFIVQAKQLLLEPTDDLCRIDPENAEQFRLVYTAYQYLLNLLNLYDFEDLIFQCIQLLRGDSRLIKELQNRFRYLFVDEFQDINYGQYTLIRLLSPSHSNICVIGDPDQSIYGFRGSDSAFFDRFLDDYKATRVITLTRNYRSVETILQSSYHVIRKNDVLNPGDGSPRPRIYSGVEGYKNVTIMPCATARSEAVAVGRAIEQLVGGTGFHALDFGKVDGHDPRQYSFADFAVLYRTTDQGRLINTIFEGAGIPCARTISQDWRKDKDVAAIVALLHILADRGTVSNLKELTFLTVPGAGQATLESFKTWAYTKQLSLSTAMHTALRLPIPMMSTASQYRLTALIKRITDILRPYQRELPVSRTVGGLIEHLIRDQPQKNENIRKLLAKAQSFDNDLHLFLTDISLLNDTDLYQPGVEQVSLLTMHASKGLEFPVVFITGCEQGFVPYQRPGVQSCDINEERRLFYVAMTRAKERLFFTWARTRAIFGKKQNRDPSPFCDDIEQALKENRSVLGNGKQKKHQQLQLF